MTTFEAALPATRGWLEPARWLLLVPPLAMSFAMVALGHDPAAAQDPLPYVFDTMTGIVLTVAGLVLWSRRPGRRTGPLLVLAGYLWYVGDAYVVADADTLWPYLGFALRGFYDPIIAFVVLAFPDDRLVRRVERWAVLALAAASLATAVWRLVATPPGFGTGYPPSAPTSPLLLIWNVDLALTVNVWLGLGVGLALLGVAALAVRRSWTLRPSARYLTAPALVGGIAWASVAALNDVATFLQVAGGVTIVPDGDLWISVQYAVRMLGPLGILLSASRLRNRSASVIEIVAGPSGAPRATDLEAALREAFDDASLRLAYPASSGWTGTDGRSVDLDRLPPARSATILESGGTPSVAILHDEVLLDDPALIRTLSAVVRLAVENDRLQADLLTQLDEVRASRARIAEAADAERRRVERDLHDGAQQRLVALLVSLRTVRSRLGPDVDPAVAEELDAASGEVRAAIAEVRELAQGLDPAILREAGLVAALRSLADRSPVPVTVDVDLATRLPPRVETVAYFVASEALANVAKHARATRAAIRGRLDAGHLLLAVSDDGVGGAEPDGGGLRGLNDRVAAADGSLRIASVPGAGTTLEMSIPCASS